MEDEHNPKWDDDEAYGDWYKEAGNDIMENMKKNHESNVDIDYDELHNRVDIDDDQNNKGQERKKTNMELWDQMSCWTWI